MIGGREIKFPWLPAVLLALPGLLFLMFMALLISLLFIKLLWEWTVPDLFPQAVAQGLVARDIGWLAAFKLALFVSVMAGISGLRSGRCR